VRFAHLSPDSPAVDVALAPVPADGGPLTDPGPDAASGLGYGDVGAYRDLAPGSYAVSVRAAGAPADTPPALSARIDVPAGSARTVAVTGLFADLALTVLADDLAPPVAGSARVRVLAAASAAGPVTVATADGVALAADLPFGDAGGYVDVPAGRAEIRLAGATPVPVDLVAGSVVTLLVLDDGGGVALRPVVDAAGPSVVPVGGVEAGTGPVSLPVGAVVVVGLVLVRRIRVPLLVVAATAAVLVPVSASPVAAAPLAVAPSAVEPPVVASPVPLPVRLSAPGIDAAVVPVGLDADGVLAAPGDPAAAGWFAGGVTPGGTGPAVLAGHVDWGGSPAAFAALGGVRPGDEVRIERADGSVVRFTVTRVVRTAKAAFPTAEVYGPTSGAELRLVTCGGRFDHAAGSYEDNVVVFASAG
jgi:hypothetical protein